MFGSVRYTRWAGRGRVEGSPGFCDPSKRGDEQFGDLVVARTIAFARSENKDVILIINDTKDWFYEIEGWKLDPSESWL